MDAADEGIDSAASFLPAADLEILRARAQAAITVASVKGVIERDPGLAAEMLEAGDFDEGLEAGRKAAFIAGAKTAQRLEEESAARELAADRRELRRDADAAIAKLRGGQPVAEVTALENRAEALEDPETRAALSHAEDDRIFMRGFAQRPLAAQADLVSAMENGPELKPVETRRLAAMKAQAAVTEQALAKDPLAYAHSSGVIDEPADLTDLAPEALRTRLRQAETAAEQFDLATLPLLRPGEAEKIADRLAKGTPVALQAKAEELAELPAEIRQALFDEIAPKLPLNARRDFRSAADLDSEMEGGGDPEPALPQPGALIDVPPEQIAQRELEAQQARHGEINAFALTRILHSQPPAEVQADFDRLQEDFFLRTGDLRLSHRLALQELDEIWGLAGEGPSLRIARRSEAEGEVQSLGALRSIQRGFDRDDLEKVFDAILLLAEFSLAGKALSGGAKVGRVLFGVAGKGKKAKRADKAVDGVDESAAQGDLDVGPLIPPSSKQLQKIEKKLGKEAAQNAPKDMARLVKEAKDKVPTEWGPAIPSKKAVGVRWADPQNMDRNGVRIDKGRPESQFSSQRVDHVIVRHNGVVIGRNGKPISGTIRGNHREAHIPLSEYVSWSTWHSP